MSRLSIIPIAMGSDNLPLCNHMHATVFRFAGAGARLIYSEHNGQSMGLGQRGGAAVVYLVGRQEPRQREFWTHTPPRQRPLPEDWRPSDIGRNPGEMNVGEPRYAR
jgi:hypothetical protein